MWISKKRYEKMENDIINLRRDVKMLQDFSMSTIQNNECLNKIHDFNMVEGKYIHTCPKVNTKTILNLTLEELAKYVIDGESIVREDTIKVKKIYK